MHSTGVASINYSKREVIDIRKKPVSSPVFLEEDNKAKFPVITGYTTDILMGHCRYATTGAVNSLNAHPFDTGDFVSMHNGTLIEGEFWDRKTDKTDSEMMFDKVEKVGLVDTLNGLSEASAYAVAVYEKETGVIQLARNNRRPIYIARHKTRNALYWSSEQEALEFIKSRNNEDLEIFYLSPFKIYSIPCDLKHTDETPWEVVELEVKKPKVTKSWSAADYVGFWGEAGSQDPAYAIEYCESCYHRIWPEKLAESVIEHSGGKSYVCTNCQTIHRMKFDVEQKPEPKKDVDEDGLPFASTIGTSTH